MRIGICSPSDPIGDFPNRIARASNFLKSKNFELIFAPNSLLPTNLDNPTSAKLKADDIHYLINKNVDLILMSTGGHNSHEVIEHLNFDLIKKSKVSFAGFSDSTSILLAIHYQAKNKCFYGPSLMGYFGDLPAPAQYSLNSFLNSINDNLSSISYSCPQKVTNESLYWDKEDNRERQYHKATPWNFSFKNIIEGSVIAANLATLLKLINCTKIILEKNTILFLEDINTADKIIESFNTLEHLLDLNQLNCLVFGRVLQLSDNENTILNKHFEYLKQKYQFHLVTNVDFSHSDPRITIPIGHKAIIDGTKKTICFNL